MFCLLCYMVTDFSVYIASLIETLSSAASPLVDRWEADPVSSYNRCEDWSRTHVPQVTRQETAVCVHPKRLFICCPGLPLEFGVLVQPSDCTNEIWQITSTMQSLHRLHGDLQILLSGARWFLLSGWKSTCEGKRISPCCILSDAYCQPIGYELGYYRLHVVMCYLTACP